MPFWKKNIEEEKAEPAQKNFVVKLKQDRYKNWICESARVQGDTIDEVKENMEALIQAVIEKTNEVNGDE
jgi:histone H3/H4|tara:strand:+ start:75 stop:284 length:210 start_codon:yes stop_codon:yes gene_type:complete